MDRAVAIVVEVGSTWTSAELRLALSRAREAGLSGKRSPQIIIVGEQTDTRNFIDITRDRVIRINVDLDSDLGINDLIEALRGVVPSDEQELLEPTRLLAKREFKAAVISAMGLLEATLRRKLDKVEWGRASRPMGVSQLLAAAFQRELINTPRPDGFETWMKIRNAAVHSNSSVGRESAEAIVSGALAIVRQLNVDY